MRQLEISPFNESYLDEGTHFVMMHLENIPPHLGILIDGSYFSISTRNKAISIPVEKVLGKIFRGRISTIFVEVQKIGEKKNMIDCLSNMPLVSEHGTNCIDPIIEFAEVNGIIIDNQKHIHDFLEKVTIIRAMAMFGEDFVHDEKYVIPTYTKEEIETLIRKNL